MGTPTGFPGFHGTDVLKVFTGFYNVFLKAMEGFSSFYIVWQNLVAVPYKNMKRFNRFSRMS